MRRFALVASLVVAVIGITIAVAMPNGVVRDCPMPGFHIPGAKCLDTPDPRATTRFSIAMAAALPALVMLALRFRGSRALRVGFVVAGLLIAVGLWWISDWVPNEMADCPPYPRCYRMGHPYAGPAALMMLVTLVFGLWLWALSADG